MFSPVCNDRLAGRFQSFKIGLLTLFFHSPRAEQGKVKDGGSMEVGSLKSGKSCDGHEQAPISCFMQSTAPVQF
jgi:hypothetical protein